GFGGVGVVGGVFGFGLVDGVVLGGGWVLWGVDGVEFVRVCLVCGWCWVGCWCGVWGCGGGWGWCGWGLCLGGWVWLWVSLWWVLWFLLGGGAVLGLWCWVGWGGVGVWGLGVQVGWVGLGVVVFVVVFLDEVGFDDCERVRDSIHRSA
ncbi:hypothetical protein RA267_27850, partial [Pseudomonas syringae pv. tagetis]|uniref:hypothetical protein n=1 Tax=Pseudomonas syringae group genomosp. 7 TaxID=251699 RepID=UPI0037705544